MRFALTNARKSALQEWLYEDTSERSDRAQIAMRMAKKAGKSEHHAKIMSGLIDLEKEASEEKGKKGEKEKTSSKKKKERKIAGETDDGTFYAPVF